MTTIDKHPPGAFCWIELATTDQPAAKNFYTSVFGWTANDAPMGPDDFYTIFKLQDRNVAAGYTLRPEQKSQGVPPHWMLYIAVENADASAKKAAQLGGKVLAEPFDVFDAGRMAVIQDPTGAVFSIWQPKTSQGIRVKNEEGAFCWADLSTADPTRAREFYSRLFGWQMIEDTDDKPASGYIHIKNGEDFIGGIPPAEHRNKDIAPHWMAYFQVSDCDATAAKAKSLGVTFYLEPMTMESVGRMAIMADPQRAVSALFQPMPRK